MLMIESPDISALIHTSAVNTSLAHISSLLIVLCRKLTVWYKCLQRAWTLLYFVCSSVRSILLAHIYKLLPSDMDTHWRSYIYNGLLVRLARILALDRIICSDCVLLAFSLVSKPRCSSLFCAYSVCRVCGVAFLRPYFHMPDFMLNRYYSLYLLQTVHFLAVHSLDLRLVGS